MKERKNGIVFNRLLLKKWKIQETADDRGENESSAQWLISISLKKYILAYIKGNYFN